MTLLTSKLLQQGVRLILMTPSVYDDTAAIKSKNMTGANNELVRYGNFIQKLATQHHAPLVDLNAAMLSINRKMQINDPKATIVGHDRVHPGNEGHLIMTYEIIDTLFEANYVSDIVLDAKSEQIITKTNCEITTGNSFLEFDVLEYSLPFPIPEDLESTLNLISNQDKYANQKITIRNLDPGNYQLLIDQVSVGEYSHTDLKNGIFLSKNKSTPQYQQAQKVSDLCFQYRKTNDYLRTIAATEFRTLKNFKGPNTLDAKKAFLIAKNEKSKGKSWYEYEKKKTKEYFKVLPKKDSLWKDLRRIRDDIYTINKPIKHSYRFIKM